jgi:hypothetical protein
MASRGLITAKRVEKVPINRVSSSPMAISLNKEH